MALLLKLPSRFGFWLLVVVVFFGLFVCFAFPLISFKQQSVYIFFLFVLEAVNWTG